MLKLRLCAPLEKSVESGNQTYSPLLVLPPNVRADQQFLSFWLYPFAILLLHWKIKLFLVGRIETTGFSTTSHTDFTTKTSMKSSESIGGYQVRGLCRVCFLPYAPPPCYREAMWRLKIIFAFVRLHCVQSTPGWSSATTRVPMGLSFQLLALFLPSSFTKRKLKSEKEKWGNNTDAWILRETRETPKTTNTISSTKAGETTVTAS